jgi:hypothetical protein
MGPLRIHPENPRYFADATGRATYVTGFHTWNNLVDMGPVDPPIPFDFGFYLAELVRMNHNFVRLWAWHMLTTWNERDTVAQFPWRRTGPGLANDGKPRFDLTQIDERYLTRLKQRIAAARDEGIYVSVMLFDGWAAILSNRTRLDRHCFAGANNVNGVDITSSTRDGIARDWLTLDNPHVLELQKRYVRAVIEAVNGFDNVLFEICNEGGSLSHDWQDHLTDYVRDVERALPARHPVGQTGGMGTLDRRIFESRADWVSPEAMADDGFSGEYKLGGFTWGSAPHDRGDRPVLLDTDHIWGIGGTVDWAYRSFCRGYNLLYMDRCSDWPTSFFEHPWWAEASNVELRRALGVIRSLASEVDLARSMPQSALSTSAYCLADVGASYLAYAPDGDLALRLPEGGYRAAFRDLVTGSVFAEQNVDGGGRATWLASPERNPCVVVVKRAP